MITDFQLFIFELSGQHGYYDINGGSIVSCIYCFSLGIWSFKIQATDKRPQCQPKNNLSILLSYVQRIFQGKILYRRIRTNGYSRMPFLQE